MQDFSWLEPSVERIVSQSMDRHAAELRDEIAQRLMEEVTAHPEAGGSSTSGSPMLAGAVSDVQSGNSQKEILGALVNSTACCAARVALFVVNGSVARGWRGRGFRENEAIADFDLDVHAAAVVRALQDRIASAAPSHDFDARFLEKFGRPKGEFQLLLPLILKNKVAALVYADAGTEGASLDASSLEVLVRFTGAWLEVNALRKQLQKEQTPATAHEPAAAVSAAPVSAAYSDPFAGQPTAHARAAAAAAGTTSDNAVHEAVSSFPPEVTGIAEVEVEESQDAIPVQSATAAWPVGQMPGAVDSGVGDSRVGDSSVGASGTTAQLAGEGLPRSAEDQEVHRKAQRFARLLVDEIKLYNKSEVSEGRKNKDLFDRLKDAIEKSEIAYQKRYRDTVAASGNYFDDELIRSLAEGDASLMGENFSR
jgi:hypothetical protein